MGRTDAVQFTLEWAAEARRLGGIVEYESGWEALGNGTSANYEGAVVHHTAFLSSEGNPFPAKSTLKTGRVGLSGPLCNVAGPWCQDGAPRLVVIAAHPANHAGASGGRSMGPLPVTSLFNPRVFGLEIDYGGVVPMTKGQQKAATIFGRAVTNVLRRNAEYVRAHGETSITGKWDPGYAPDKTIDMAAFRQGITNFAPTTEEDFLMGLTQEQQNNAITTIGEIRYAILSLVKPSTDQIPGLLAKIVADGANDLTEADVIAAARKGVEEGVKNIGAVIRQVVLDTLGEDNADQADEIVDKLVSRLAA